jgi:hypothetical protein
MIYFSNVRNHIHTQTENDYCYFFMFRPHTTINRAFVKIGITEQRALNDRLSSYGGIGIYPINIYYISTSQVKNRESMMIELFKSHRDIKTDHGREYFEGPFDTMINIYAYVVLLSESLINVNPTQSELIRMYKKIDKFKYTVKYINSKILYTFYLLTSVIEPTDNINVTQVSCDGCNRMFKDARGLSVHKKRCRPDYSTTCNYCQHTYKTIYNLNDHYITCIPYHVAKTKEEYETRITDMQATYEEKINELQLKYNHINIVSDIKYIKNLESKINQLEAKHKIISQRMMSLAEELL